MLDRRNSGEDSMRPLLLLPALALGVLLAACGHSRPVANLPQKAETIMPPGQSGFYSTQGQAAGSSSQNPADYGPNVDDQRLPYWTFQYKDGSFEHGGTPVSPAPPNANVDIVLDGYGVPTIHAADVYDLWYGAGYVAAKQRLFLMDAIRRFAHGTAGALLGCTYVPQDIQTRTLTYTDAEYQAFYDRMQPDSKDAFRGYVDGANAWLAQVQGDPNLLPAEYSLLSATPEAFTIADFLAAGVFMTRRVAAEGGDEFFNVTMLRQLEQAYGKAEGRNMFLDLVWDEDRKAVTTVPSDQTFSNNPLTPEQREAVFDARADWAVTLPDTIWVGPGTGGAAEPAPCSKGADPTPVASIAPTKPAARLARAPQKKHAAVALASLQGELRGLLHEIDRLHGGSWAVAIGRSRTRDRGALLISSPQLGYSYPTYLWEAEVHGAGYDARGVSVPGLPVIGIGYTPNVAWALTTGYSKTIDSFVETTCSTAQQQAGTCAANQYFHDGAWRDMDCRTETITYRSSDSTTGLPSGAATLSVSQPVCRTVHGPIVARDDAAGLARSLAYSMWMHEVDTVEGVREWSRARNLDEFVAATAQVTWNENVTFATRYGDIGYVHPGRIPDRSPDADQRLPTPGTGAYDFRGWLPFSYLPKSFNPAQGYLANWNTKPALGWLDGEGISVNSRPAGPGQRVTTLMDVVSQRSDWTYEDLKTIDRITGTRDQRARSYLPQFQRFYAAKYDALTDGERHALDLMIHWDRSHYGPDVTVDDPNSTDTPAATIFDAWINALHADLFGQLEQYVLYAGDRDLDADGDPEAAPLDPDGNATNVNIYNRSKGVGSHRYDMSVMDNLILRVLDPSTSSLAVRHDWLRGRERDDVLLATLRSALSALAQQYGTSDPPSAADVETFRRVHPKRKICSLTGVIGPGSTTPSPPNQGCVLMPFQDRGSWIHLVGWEDR